MNTAQFLISLIEGLGVDRAFSLTGGMAMHINHAVAKSKIKVIYCNHEQAVVAAADGYARAKEFNVPGLAVVTSGPGVTNTVTSVASAFYDSVPLFVLAGQVKSTDINIYGVRSRGAQEVPQLNLMRQVSKLAFRYDPNEINDVELADFIAEALLGRKGPVYIEVPLDVQAIKVSAAEIRVEDILNRINQKLIASKSSGEDVLESMSYELSHAQKPILVIGNGVRISGVTRDAIEKLIQHVNIPTLFTWASFDLFPHAHNLNYGCAGGLAPTHSNQILQSADLVIFLGARLDLLTTAYNPENYGKNAKRIIVELDDSEILKNVSMTNVVFYKQNVFTIFEGYKKINQSKNSEWLNYCSQLREIDLKKELDNFSNNSLSTYQVSKVFSDLGNDIYIVPTASGFAIEGVARFFKPKKGANFAWAGHCLGSMGLGLPSAIGAASISKVPVVCLEGDGGVLLNIQEIATIKANKNLPITLVVLNNLGYQSIVKSQERAFGEQYGASINSGLSEVSFEQLAQIAGLQYVKITTLDELRNAAINILKNPRQLIEVLIDDDSYRGPSVTTRFDKNGKPYSTDIGDVEWR